MSINIKIIDRYIIKEIAGPLILGLSIFTFALFMGRMVELTELVIVKGVDLSTVLQLFLYIMPSLLVLTIPMSMLLGTLVAFGRLSADSEITALKANGIGLYRLWLPGLVVAVVCFLVTFYLTLFALPWANYGFKQTVFKILNTSTTAALRERVFNTMFKDFIIYTQRVDDKEKKLEGVFISDQRDPKVFRIINAREGQILADQVNQQIIIDLKKGTIHQYNPKNLEKYQILNFESLRFTHDLSKSLALTEKAKKTDRDMTLEELNERIVRRKKSGEPSWNYQVEWHKKFAMPAVCFALILLGPPLGVQARRSGRMTGFTISLVLIFIYYLLITVGEALGDKGKIPPILAMWGPDFILGGLGAYALTRTAREAPFKPLLMVIDLTWRAYRLLNPFAKKEKEEDRP